MGNLQPIVIGSTVSVLSQTEFLVKREMRLPYLGMTSIAKVKLVFYIKIRRKTDKESITLICITGAKVTF